MVAASTEQKRCPTCKSDKSLTDFDKNRRQLNGVQTQCRECRKSSRGRDRRQVIAHYSNGTNNCECCGENRVEFLAIDHIKGGGSQHRRSIKTSIITWIIKRWKKEKNFPEGFRVLCYNCNGALGYSGYCPHKTKNGNMNVLWFHLRC